MASAQSISLKPDVNTMLVRWKEITAAMSTLKSQELELRQAIIDAILPADRTEGSSTFEIGNGWKLKAERKQNYTLDRAHVDALLDLLPQNIQDDLVRWKPELSMTAYRKSLPAYAQALPEDKRKILSDALVNAVTIKPGTPELKLEPPKGE